MFIADGKEKIQMVESDRCITALCDGDIHCVLPSQADHPLLFQGIQAL